MKRLLELVVCLTLGSVASFADTLFVGAPDTVAAKIARVAKALGLSRFDLKYSHGTLPHDTVMTSIALYGTRVAPRLRQLPG